ncbi:MAG: GntR family transcriptional regulator [Porticoccaceae bacterium]
MSSQSLVDQLYERLRVAIIHGDMPVGSKISETELARTQGVSRGTVREALGRLEAGYLITRKTNAGARVVELSLTELVEIYQVREALEGMACRLAAERMTATEIADLRDLLAHHQRDSELQEGRAYYQQEGDLDFHFRLVQSSGNSKLIHVLCDDLYAKVRMYRYHFGMVSARVRDAFVEHVHIVDAIADRDGEMAEMLMRRHIRASRINSQRQLLARAAPITDA